MEDERKSEPCPSEASSISAEGDNLKINNKTFDDSKALADKSSSRAFADLNLTNIEDKKIELNLFNASRVEAEGGATSASDQASDQSSKETTAIKEKSRVFSCNYCKREFSTSQALGGHQNAHKQERQMAKRRQLEVLPYGGHLLPPPAHYGNYSYYPSFAHLTNNSSNRSSSSVLGVRNESFIQRPFSWGTSSSSLMNYRFSSIANHHDQFTATGLPYFDRPKILESFQQGNNITNNGVGGFGSPLVASSSFKLDDRDKGALHDFFAVPSVNNNNNANLTNGIESENRPNNNNNNLLAHMGVVRPEDDQDGGLDLNLKL